MVEQNVIALEQVYDDRGHRARLEVRIGGRARINAEVAVTSAGLLSIGALVSSILLSTAVIVRAAHPEKHGDRDKRKRERKRLRRM